MGVFSDILLPAVGLQSFVEYEKNFTSDDLFDYTIEHTEVPIFAVGIYLLMIFYLPQHLGSPWPIRKQWGVWNLLLSLFSIVGASRCLPHLYDVLRTKGFVYTVCGGNDEHPLGENKIGSEWYTTGGPGLWVGLFIYSKIPELLDTAFLTFQKKPVIFLHWFHHVTVLLYCWHAYHHQVASGLWFASMNYCVHSIMYFYYFIMIFPSPKTVRKAAQKIAPLITTIQILQMVGGIIVTATGAHESIYSPHACKINASNYKLGLAMYGSYFVLFVALFADKFLKPKKPKEAKQAPQEFCNATVSNDAAGFFHGKLAPGLARSRSRSRSRSPSPAAPKRRSSSKSRAKKSQ